MTKQHAHYVCSNCGETVQRWAGKCPQCGEWNTLQEQLVINSPNAKGGGKKLEVQSVGSALAKDYVRLASSINEVDDVLGGGLVAGSVDLIAGQPGIGKSTLLLQLAYELSKKYPALYISAEESAHQVGLRAGRLGTNSKNLQL